MRLIEDPAAAYVVAHRENEDRVELDCGHLATPNYFLVHDWQRYADTPGQGVSGTPGYGTDPDTGKRLCYACCTAGDVEDMRTAERFTAYVSSDGKRLVNWPGGDLGRITSLHTSRAARKTYVQAVDVHGQAWHGQGPAERGTYVNLRRAKG